jgi:ubiquitin-like-conjugating enzyme ATG3
MLGSLRKAREWAYPTLTKSAFLEKGVLTPEEFVHAGDELVYRCPTWAWEAGDESKRKSYLPPDKQYLITRNVPCQTRVSAMETNMSMANGEGDDDDWLVSTIIKEQPQNDTSDDEFDILDSEGELVTETKPAATTDTDTATATAAHDAEEEEYTDMADFEDDNVLQDDAAAHVHNRHDNDPSNVELQDNIIKVRTYDLSITYDKYYQTPRVWIIGRSTTNQPLTAQEMMQDVISDYANKTVTMESHPHVSGQHASIHPCQHAKVMKAIVRNLIKSSSSSSPSDDHDNDNETADDPPDPTATTTTAAAAAAPQGPSVEMYLFIFLKFVSSMIPTINYDFTMDVMADTSK